MIFQYILLSIVQAVTEFLPISSSGHLLFFKGLMNVLDVPLIFDIVVHVGSLSAIVFFYRKKIRLTCQSAFHELSIDGPRPNLRFIFYIIISTAVTFLIYILFKDSIESQFETPRTLPFTYLLTTAILLLPWFKRDANMTDIIKKKIHVPIITGLLQGLAILPGVSRSGSTISSLLFMAVKKEDSAYYAFFLAIPAIGGALIFQLFELNNFQFLVRNWVSLSLSLFTSVVFSYLFLRFLVWIIHKGKMWMFSIYTFILAVLSWVLF